MCHHSPVLSLENEIEEIRPVLGDATTAALIARERREVFSIYPELRFCAWGGASLLAAAAGLVLKNNLERIGPLMLSLLIGAAATICYAVVWVRRARAGLVDDYILLLGALLLSADVAFVETQYHLLEEQWQWHLFLVAAIHGVTAYVYRSRLVLSLSIAALAAWMGVERRTFAGFWSEPVEFATRAWLCALVLIVWRAIDRQAAAKKEPQFSPLFEHFAANLALGAGMALWFDDATRPMGAVATIVVAAGVIAWGFRQRSESFVLYAFVYVVIALDVLVIDTLGTGIEELVFLFIVGSMIGAIVALLAIHARFRRLRA